MARPLTEVEADPELDDGGMASCGGITTAQPDGREGGAG